jgi:hypothetical protein
MSFWDCQWKEAHGIDLVCEHAERFPDGDVPRMGIDFDEVGSLAHILDIKSVSEFSLDTMVQLSVHNPWYHNSDESSYCMIPLLAIIT